MRKPSALRTLTQNPKKGAVTCGRPGSTEAFFGMLAKLFASEIRFLVLLRFVFPICGAKGSLKLFHLTFPSKVARLMGVITLTL